MANLVLKNNTSGGKTSVTADNFIGTATHANILQAQTGLTADNIDNFLEAKSLKWATADATVVGNDGVVMSIGWSASYGAQIWLDDGSDEGGMKFRNRKADGWNPWRQVLTENNYTSYAPTKTGSGASGTWGISVTGYSNKLNYGTAQLTTDAAIDAFNAANTFQVTTWNSTSTPGVSNGVIINAGWTSTQYGAQIAIDDDPTYYIALRQKGTSGWNAWKRIPMGDGTGASGTWGISITGNAATATAASNTANVAIRRSISGSTHAEALKAEFNSYKASIPRNTLSTYYSTAYGNGSFYMGYFLSGYDTSPYGGFFAAHYTTPYYIGIANGSFSQQTILTSSNYNSWCAPASHSHSYLPLSGGVMTGNISYKGSQATYEMIRFLNNSSDTYGNGISIGGGGATIIGGGESAAALQGLISSGGSEEMLIGNDGAIKFYSNCQDGTSSAKLFTMTAGGDFNAPSISTSANIGCHINGRADVSCLLLTNEQWTGYGTVDPNGNLTAVVGRVYFRIV